jgi:hypothetical protein
LHAAACASREEFYVRHRSGPIPRGHAGYFHGHVKTWARPAFGIDHPVNVGHAACMQAIANAKTIQFGARF